MKSYSFLPILLCTFLLASFCSGAVPNSQDVRRVKKDYLSLRFQRPFHPALQDLSDRQLMALSCRKNQIQCPKLLELLKKQDKKFYEKYQALIQE